MKYCIITEIEGIKNYMRRYRENKKGFIVPTMMTTNPEKALDFGKSEKASEVKSKMGIGFAIEVIN